MVVNVTSVSGQKVRSVRYGVLSNGVLIGRTATAPTAGDQDGSAMKRLDLIKNFPFQPLDPEVLQQTGDGGAGVSFINTPNELPTGALEFGTNDLAFYALVQSMLTRNMGGATFTPGQPKNPTFLDVCWLVQAPAKIRDGSANAGASHWEGIAVWNTNVYPRGRSAFQDSGLPVYNYGIVGNYATQTFWGEAFTVPNWGDTEMVFAPFTSPYEMTAQAFTLDGVETDFNLAETLAADDANTISVIKNGTPLTWVASSAGATEFEADASAGTISLGSAGTSGDELVVWYGIG